MLSPKVTSTPLIIHRRPCMPKYATYHQECDQAISNGIVGIVLQNIAGQNSLALENALHKQPPLLLL